MTNKLLDAITIHLYDTFGDSYHYYVENVQQKLQKPCFTVDAITSTVRSRNATLYDRTMLVVIHYFSNDPQNIKKDCYRVAERVVECLEYLPIEAKTIRGEDISYDIVDDVLQVQLTYRFRTQQAVDTADVMESVVETKISHI